MASMRKHIDGGSLVVILIMSYKSALLSAQLKERLDDIHAALRR